VSQGDPVFPDGNVSNPTPNNVIAPVCVPWFTTILFYFNL
jgi:hypothetical protein